MGVRQTLSSAEKSPYRRLVNIFKSLKTHTGKLILRQGSANRPDAFKNISIKSNRIDGKRCGDSRPKIVECPKPGYRLFDGSNSVPGEISMVGRGVETRTSVRYQKDVQRKPFQNLRSSDVARARCNPFVLSTDGDILVCFAVSLLARPFEPETIIPFASNVGHKVGPQLLWAFEIPK